MNENNNNVNGNGKSDYLDMAEYHLRLVGLDPTLQQNFEEYTQLIPKVVEMGLADNERSAMRIAAEALQKIRHTQDINEKEARGEPLASLDRLTRHYTMTGPPQAASPTPRFERANDDRPAFEKLNDYYKRNKP